MDKEEEITDRFNREIVIETISRPSKTIRLYETTICIEDVPINLTLVTMKHSILIVIHDSGSKPILNLGDMSAENKHIAREIMIQGFMSSNTSLKGLALGIGEHGTYIISSDSALNSATLASRISKKLNANRPVYVANNITQPQQVLDSDTVIAKFYMKVFQFVRSNYACVEQKQEETSVK